MSHTSEKKEVDILVLGAGVAGVVAAHQLSKHGLTVAIVDKTGGATGQSSGAVDVAHTVSHSHESVGFVEAAKYIAKTELNHPYAHLGEKKLESIQSALQALKEVASDVDLVLREDARNMLLATQVGTLKHSAMAQRTQGFDFSDLSDGDSVAIVGFSGLPSFDARAVARMLTWSLESLACKKIVVEPIEVDFRPQGRLWRSPLEMAMSFEQPKIGEAFESALREATAHESEHQAYLLPPILGRHHFKKMWQAINDGVGERYFELLAMPHSVPALRLKDAIAHGLAALGVDVVEGEAMGFTSKDSRINTVMVEGKEAQLEIAARHVILATGRFFAGGFEREDQKREKIFGLPTWQQGKDIFSAGLRVDEKFRPYDKMMELFALNLFAAGSSIGGYDAGGTKSGLGLAALTGYLAALHTIEAQNP